MDSPLNNWLKERHAGVLLHPTSLPGAYGIGALDEHAGAFLEFLSLAGFKYWQICPLGPTGYGDSPYQCFSAFAGNPYLISLESMVEEGLLGQDLLDFAPDFPAGQIDYGAIYHWKLPLLRQAAIAFHGMRLALDEKVLQRINLP